MPTIWSFCLHICGSVVTIVAHVTIIGPREKSEYNNMTNTRLFIRHLSTIGVAATVLTGAAVTVAAGVDAAVPAGVVRTSGALLNVRQAPNTTSAILRQIKNRSSVALECSMSGITVKSPAGVKTKLWYRTTKGGYVSDAFLRTGSNRSITKSCVGESGRTWGKTDTYNSGAAGNCTWGAYEMFRKRTGVYPRVHGNAKDVAASATAHGWTVVLPAQANSIVVFQPGVAKANRKYGHMAWVTSVEHRRDGVYIDIVEMNWRGLGQWSTRTVKDVHGMSYILAPR
jgi:surface antigen